MHRRVLTLNVAQTMLIKLSFFTRCPSTLNIAFVTDFVQEMSTNVTKTHHKSSVVLVVI